VLYSVWELTRSTLISGAHLPASELAQLFAPAGRWRRHQRRRFLGVAACARCWSSLNLMSAVLFIYLFGRVRLRGGLPSLKGRLFFLFVDLKRAGCLFLCLIHSRFIGRVESSPPASTSRFLSLSLSRSLFKLATSSAPAITKHRAAPPPPKPPRQINS